jgi:glyoxylase-like metal-dependent hydrolase (beta-lactamase superfamily II)
MRQLQRGIFIEDSFLGVTVGGMVFPHGTILIDAPLRTEDARGWRSALMNQRSSANRLLVNLDAHPDRTLGARTMDCTVVAHQKAANLFRNRPAIFKGQSIETGAEWESYGDVIGMRWGTPDITFSQTLTLNWGAPEVVLEQHPGPAQGAIWAILPSEKIIFVGDAVVNNQPPFLAGADLSDWVDALEFMYANYRDFIIISGRGGVTPPQNIILQQTFLRNVMRGLDKLAKRNAAADATEDLLPGLLGELTLPAEKEEKYTQRLRYGLYQYYVRRYRLPNAQDPNRLEESEP